MLWELGQAEKVFESWTWRKPITKNLGTCGNSSKKNLYHKESIYQADSNAFALDFFRQCLGPGLEKGF